jgi:hypothetical protein
MLPSDSFCYWKTLSEGFDPDESPDLYMLFQTREIPGAIWREAMSQNTAIVGLLRPLSAINAL